jgi:hypothetical protein
MRDMDIFHTISGQCDPTAGKALSNLIREENRALRQKEKKLQDLTASRRHFTPAATAEPYKELANAMIALAYSDYVDVLRTLEAIPEPAPTVDEKIIAKHQNRIDQLKAEMEDIEEFFYSPLFALACDIEPDLLVNKAWEEAYK